MIYFDYFYYLYYCMNIKREKLGHKDATFGACCVLFIMLFPVSLPIAKILRYMDI